MGARLAWAQQKGTAMQLHWAEQVVEPQAEDSAPAMALKMEAAGWGWPDQFPLLALPWELGRAAVLEVLDLRAKEAARAGDYAAWARAAAWAFRVAAASPLEFDHWRSVALAGRSVVVARGSL